MNISSYIKLQKERGSGGGGLGEGEEEDRYATNVKSLCKNDKKTYSCHEQTIKIVFVIH